MPDTKNETTFVLPAAAVPGADGPVHFGGFPGVYTPDVPVAVSSLGFETLDEARKARKLLAPELVEKSGKTAESKGD